MDRTVALAPIWRRVVAWRRKILVLMIVMTGVVAAIAYLLPTWYQARAEILPPSEEDTGVGVANLLRGIGMPGVRIPTEITPADVFIVVLGSRRIGEELVNRFDLKRVYRVKLMVDALAELRRHSRFKLTEQGSIQIAVEDRNRQRAADIANAYIELLDRFNREIRMTKGRRARIFIESRLAEVKRQLEASEDRLAAYQSRTKAGAISPQFAAAAEEAAKLYARRMALEIRLGVVRGFSSGTDEEVQLRQELAQLDRKLGSLPGVGMDMARMVRDVTALEQVYAFLLSQYEDARVTEARDVTTVDVLDAAVPPERKSRPRRGIMIASAFLLSAVLGVGAANIAGESDPRQPAASAG